MALVESVVGSVKLHRPAAVLLDELRHLVESGQFSGNWTFLCLCLHRMSPLETRFFPLKCLTKPFQEIFLPNRKLSPDSYDSTCRVSFQTRISGSARLLCSQANMPRLAVLSSNYLPPAGSSPSQRAPSTRRKWPLEKIRTSPCIARKRLTTRSARAPI